MEQFVRDSTIFSERNIVFDYMINYQTPLKKILFCVKYTELATKNHIHKRYFSYSLLPIRTQAAYFVFVVRRA